jgi:hypothetical protein
MCPKNSGKGSLSGKGSAKFQWRALSWHMGTRKVHTERFVLVSLFMVRLFIAILAKTTLISIAVYAHNNKKKKTH